MRTLRCAARATALAVATAVTFAVAMPSASALAPVDLGLAVAETNVAIGLAAVEFAKTNAENPNVTCSMPVVHGANVVQSVATPAASVNGQDVAEAAALCVSLTGESFTAFLDVVVEYRSPGLSGGWGEVCPGYGAMSSIDGVAPVVAVAHCLYGPDHPAAGRPHRAHAILTTSLGSRFENYSEPWQG